MAAPFSKSTKDPLNAPSLVCTGFAAIALATTLIPLLPLQGRTSLTNLEWFESMAEFEAMFH